LTPAQRTALQAWLHRPVAPRLRVRLQGALLRDQGWMVPQIAERLGVSQATVRRALRRVRADGLDAAALVMAGGRFQRRRVAAERGGHRSAAGIIVGAHLVRPMAGWACPDGTGRTGR
jgi:hypothetical protein